MSGGALIYFSAECSYKKFGLPYYWFSLHNISLVSYFVFILCSLSFFVHIAAERALIVFLTETYIS